jgi:hypothetical protein
VLGLINVLMTPDAKSYVYAFTRQLSDLYLVKGCDNSSYSIAL